MILYFNNCTKRYVADQAIANGITAATDIPLTVPLSATEKGTLSHQKPSMMVEAAGPLSWGVARLFFGMPKNVGRAALAEQARLKEQAAKEQESKAKSIKDKNRIKQLKMTT